MRIRSKSRSRSSLSGLRLAIDCMPVATRQAMLEGVRLHERIIVGAYVDAHGGVCPMLAAHRCGGRTDFLSFAKSWDRFARARGKPRAASARELAILVTQLECSLASATHVELDVAISEHRALRSRSRPRASSYPEGDPSREIRARRLRPSARARRPTDPIGPVGRRERSPLTAHA